MRTFAVVTAIALGLVAAGASAQAIDDAQIAHIVVTANQVDIDAGKLAASMATGPEVKKFGQKMVDDHSKADDQLKQVATSKGVTLPPSLDKSTQREMDKLSAISDRLEAGEGSAGKLLRDPSLYNNADQMLVETRGLVKNIRENPKKYLTIHFKVF